ncbi:MAG: hypothetical protein JSW66_02115 [Phycisphaerales bacterium]|nr:MAG: hypothetical protein JSW66_02115 [Phycisphaerales bacterium]
MKQTGKRKRAPLSRTATVALALMGLVLAGCDSLRFAPSEAQKQNAWLHNRTALVTAETARAEQTSPKLQALAQLGEIQSRAFSAYCGLPEEFPPTETAEDILAESNWQLAGAAFQTAAERPDAWQVADSMLELGIGICALLGGVYGTRAVRFLGDARGKSQALKEIIAGNELFKKQNASASAAFKQAHQNQSPQTRQLVAQMKT